MNFISLNSIGMVGFEILESYLMFNHVLITSSQYDHGPKPMTTITHSLNNMQLFTCHAHKTI